MSVALWGEVRDWIEPHAVGVDGQRFLVAAGVAFETFADAIRHGAPYAQLTAQEWRTRLGLRTNRELYEWLEWQRRAGMFYWQRRRLVQLRSNYWRRRILGDVKQR